MKFKKQSVIKTQRLSLHAFDKKDKQNMIDILTNEEVGKTFMVPVFESEEQKNALFERYVKLSNSTERFVYGIYLKDNLIGFINDVCVENGEVEIGYVIHPNFKGNGYATEAVTVAINEILNSGYSTVKAGAFEGNLASMRVMQKSGMKKIEQVDCVEYRGVSHRCVYYAKSK
jgi:RimJ/RimL family protein N-acetyltransferase